MKKERPARVQVFGIHAVEALLASDPGRVIRIMMLAGDAGGVSAARLMTLLEQARQQRIPVVEVTERGLLDEQVQGQRHQGVIAECTPAPPRNERDLDALLAQLPGAALLLVLDGVQDPHNLGACLRSADAAGVAAVVAPRDRASGITAVVSKVASGAAESVPFVQVTNLARTLRHLQEQGIWLIGLDERAEQTLFETALDGPVALVLGAEGRGLRRLTREHCDHLVSIPMAGSVASLNVSVAAGVCLFEARRQRLAVRP